MQNKRFFLTVGFFTLLFIVTLVASTGAACVGDCPDSWKASVSPVKRTGIKEAPTKEVGRTVSTPEVNARQSDRSFALASNIPLKDRYPSLVKLADAGDGKAACTLAWSLDFCLNKHNFLDHAQVSLANVEMGGAEEQSRLRSALSSANHYDRLFADALAVCDGFSQPDEESVDRRLYQAASLGSIRSMSKFAVNPTVEHHIDISTVEIMTLYKENAKSFLTQAALAGDPEAILGVYYVQKRGYLGTKYGMFPMKLDAVTVASALTIVSESDAIREASDAPELLNKVLAAMTIEERNNMREVIGRQKQKGVRRSMEDLRQQLYKSPQDICDME